MINIKFSRHVKRRLKLYDIGESDIIEVVELYLQTEGLKKGRYVVISEELAAKYGLPIKVVFVIEEDEVIVVTAYPLKGGRRL